MNFLYVIRRKDNAKAYLSINLAEELLAALFFKRSDDAEKYRLMQPDHSDLEIIAVMMMPVAGGTQKL